MNGIRIAIIKDKGGTVDKISILEKTDIFFKDDNGKYVSMFDADVAYIEVWKVKRIGSKVKGIFTKRFKVETVQTEKIGEG